MMDIIRTYLSGRRAAALLFVLITAVLMGIGAWLAFSGDDAPPPPILLNDPPPPVHTGGEPYPPGTFPPRLEVVWERATDYLRQPARIWENAAAVSPDEYAEFFLQNPSYDGINFLDDRLLFPPCPPIYIPPDTYIYVENQLLFNYDEALEDPEAAISGELRTAGVEFDSITVLTAADYAEHAPEFFYNRRYNYNWRSIGRSDHIDAAILERLGAELHPDVRAYTAQEFHGARAKLYEADGYELGSLPQPPPPPSKNIYQVKLHGFTGSVLWLRVPNSAVMLIAWDSCGGFPEMDMFSLLVGGLYTVFGNDVVIALDGSLLTGPELPEPAAILLNDPPPPVHISSEPYPHGTFPPEVAEIWERVTSYLQQPVSTWGGGTVSGEGYVAFFARYPNHPESPANPAPCGTSSQNGWHIENQLLFNYGEAPEDPEAAISDALRSAGAEFESITVLTASHYAEYDPKTFYNWLSTDNSRYSRFAALERLGAEVHPNAREFNSHEIESQLSRFIDDISADIHFGSERGHEQEAPPKTIYQVKLHGFAGDVRELEVPDGQTIGELHHCHSAIDDLMESLTNYLAGGLYTTFGDDVVIIRGGVTLTGDAPQG